MPHLLGRRSEAVDAPDQIGETVGQLLLAQWTEVGPESGWEVEGRGGLGLVGRQRCGW